LILYGEVLVFFELGFWLDLDLLEVVEVFDFLLGFEAVRI